MSLNLFSISEKKEEEKTFQRTKNKTFQEKIKRKK